MHPLAILTWPREPLGLLSEACRAAKQGRFFVPTSGSGLPLFFSRIHPRSPINRLIDRIVMPCRRRERWTSSRSPRLAIARMVSTQQSSMSAARLGETTSCGDEFSRCFMGTVLQIEGCSTTVGRTPSVSWVLPVWQHVIFFFIRGGPEFPARRGCPLDWMRN
jgi:hypothetical protein